MARREGFTYVVAATGGCRLTHLLTSVRGETARYEPCFDATPGLWDELMQRHRPDLVVALDGIEIRDFVEADGTVRRAGTPEQLAGERVELLRLAERFTTGDTVLAFVEVPPVVTPPDCLRESTWELDACERPAAEDPASIAYNDVLASVVRDHPRGTYLVSINDHLCPNDVCPPVVGGVVARYDGHHFSGPGARWAAPLLYSELVKAGAIDPTD